MDHSTTTKVEMAISQAVSTIANSSSVAVAAAVTRVDDVARSQGSSSWLGLIARLVLFILHILSSILYWSLKLTTISVPTLLFTLFSTTWTVTMNATTLALILLLMASAVTWVVRYRYLNMYSRLPPEPQRKEPELDLFPEGHDEGAKPGLTNYLDEFLSAIKIFGYLERPVFHELTRSMQTRKLIAGETLNLEEEKGFCLVVDGLVEIFVKSSNPDHSSRYAAPHGSSMPSSFSDDEQSVPGQQRYQLLTEVRNGNPMSSLFSIMSLFTEDVKLKLPSEDALEPGGNDEHSTHQRLSSATFTHENDMPVFLTGATDLDRAHRGSAVAYESEVTAPSSPSQPTLPKIPPISLDDSPMPRKANRPIPKRTATSVHPDIIARATVDTTIAIIPASAFRRLIRVYPKATAHIVHVILSRFQRVTLATAYNYLGLTNEVLHTEKNMIHYTTCQLPNILRGDALERLKEKFKQERERAGEEESGKGIALHNASATARRRSSSTSLRKEAALQAMSRARPQSVVASIIVPPQDRLSIHSPSPGDLLANVQIARGGGSSGNLEIPDIFRKADASPLGQRAFNPFATQKRARLSIDPRESVDEDNLFRVSVLECVFKALGMSSGGSSSRGPGSTEGSPRLVSYDQRRQKAVFSSNAFGFMDPFDGATDWDAESMTSGGISMSTPNVQFLASEMKHDVEIVFFRQGSVLVEQGERSPGLYYVIDGFLDICVPLEDSGSNILSSSSRTSTTAMHRAESQEARRSSPLGPVKDSNRTPNGKQSTRPDRRRVGLVKPGGLAGYVGTVSSYRSFIDVVAKTDVYVGFIPRATLEKIVERYPIVLLTMAKRLTSLLPKLILHIDFALEWVQVNAGQVLFHKDEESEAIYLVLNGRLRLVEDRRDGGMNVRAEFGQGDSVGELEVMTESTRSGTLHAIRATELVKFPRTLFNSLAQEHPNITIKISKIIAARMRLLVDDPSNLMGKEATAGTSINKISSTLNIRTVAILPVRAGIPVVDFGNRLMNALTQVGTPNGATSLNQAAILSHLGKHAFNKMGNLKLSHYLADLEEKYGLVVYVADTSVTSPWTQTCITQADCILLVGLAEGSPEIGEYERFMLGMKSTARKTLVLLHADRYSPPGLTRAWLRNRVWINGGHYHLQMAFEANTVSSHPPARKGGPTLKERVQILQAEIQKYTVQKIRQRPYYSPDAPYKGDFQRLARRLCGKSIGLVLGGGGARGIAQVGIIKALEEAGIPIDIVGGTSIGSFIGALYARHADIVPMFGLAKKFAGRMASMWRFALDLTYPSASYTTGHEFNRGIFKTFGKHQIEDFWLEYYCNTTNISKSRPEIHTSGYAWRYVRASMSLAGLLPPLCDEGSMLLDGGYIDNLTVSHMKSLGASVIFAIDVGSLDDDTPQGYGDSLSGVWAFFNRWNPFSSIPNPPTLAEIQARLAYVSSVDALERAKMTPGCIYMRPPIDEYGTLDFGKFDEIYGLGYKYGKEFLDRLKEEGVLPLVEETEAKKALRRTMAPRRASI
ncbi:lysophospholipase NTE1 [Annulohypoxylon maeteangense]|uniref:lysophospholipase NTE1 n=1 Tax=Annulohypoxylon maeteangense TaxID=1927788 RepID=UPI0020077648|nr:lysophospholipase NTE1 [Annulohypoxylon maeteangense]KAI0890440.1 lysophospholipase NTE1 [Annulohypoxylon maeteangense]